MSSDDHRLGDFLRARRERLDPEAVGLSDYGRRRVKGLRREELAMLAGVSAPYYARLEQGRDTHPSPQILAALAAALQLDADAAAHLRALAEPQVAEPRRRTRRPERVRPGLAHLLSRWADQPAVVIGRHRDVLAATPLATVLHSGFDAGRNLVRDVFLDPAVRADYVDWDEVARGAVASLRASSTHDPDDPRLTDLVGELSIKSPEFAAMWARHDVKAKTSGTKRFDNAFVGRLTLEYESFDVTGSDGQMLYVFFADPGSVDEHALALLGEIASGAATPRTVR
ncbi:MAG: helix-turn-helix transcriptional regulator [Solirubrobacteraceae bacterium]|nr:helix-turn-helix transcriptional regulator [Patulibacter sp.]